jgi:hypothetical protein
LDLKSSFRVPLLLVVRCSSVCIHKWKVMELAINKSTNRQEHDCQT